MRHPGLAVVVGLAICSGSTAQAADHLMHISEVLLSSNNDTNIRYVELADPGLEPFPSTYRLVVYDAAGGMVETVNLTVPANTQRMLIGTAAADTAFATTRDATLTMPLPVDGQVCFERGTGTTAVKIHCLAWGCVTSLIPGASRGPSPSTGMSVQRQANGMYQVGTPTPDANNVAGTTMAACPTEPDAPPMPDAGVVADAAVGPDAGGGGGNNNPDDEGGCCQVDGHRGAAGAGLLAIGVLLALRGRRRRRG